MRRTDDHPTSVRLPKRLRKTFRDEARRERRNASDHLIYILQWWYGTGGSKVLRKIADEVQEQFVEKPADD